MQYCWKKFLQFTVVLFCLLFTVHGSTNLACSSCKAADVRLRRCVACKSVYYCSTACQKENWPNHKSQCFALRSVAQSQQPRTLDENVVEHNGLHGSPDAPYNAHSKIDNEKKGEDFFNGYMKEVIRYHEESQMSLNSKLELVDFIESGLFHATSDTLGFAPLQLILLKNPNWVYARDFNDQTVLMHLCITASTKLAIYFLETCVSPSQLTEYINLRAKDGRNAVFLAAEESILYCDDRNNESLLLVQYLLKKGADISVTNRHGENIMNILTKQRNLAMIYLIKKTVLEDAKQ